MYSFSVGKRLTYMYKYDKHITNHIEQFKSCYKSKGCCTCIQIASS